MHFNTTAPFQEADSIHKCYFQNFAQHSIKSRMVNNRTESECSDFDFTDLEVAGVEPLTLDDITFEDSYVTRDDFRYFLPFLKATKLTDHNLISLGRTLPGIFYQGLKVYLLLRFL